MNKQKELQKKVDIKYKEIERKNTSKLIEYTDSDGLLQRSWLPIEEDNSQASKGIPYGVPFAQLLNIKTTASDVQQKLRNRGLWTYKDLEQNQELLLNAIKEALSIDRANILKVARNFERR